MAITWYNCFVHSPRPLSSCHRLCASFHCRITNEYYYIHSAIKFDLFFFRFVSCAFPPALVLALFLLHLFSIRFVFIRINHSLLFSIIAFVRLAFRANDSQSHFVCSFDLSEFEFDYVTEEEAQESEKKITERFLSLHSVELSAGARRENVEESARMRTFTRAHSHFSERRR